MVRGELEIWSFKLWLSELGFRSFQHEALSWFEFFLGDSIRDLSDNTNLHSRDFNLRQTNQALKLAEK